MVVDTKVRVETSEHPWSKDHLPKSLKAKIMHTSRDETRYKVEFSIHLQDKHSSCPYYVRKVFCKLPWDNLFYPVRLFLRILLTRKGREKMGVDYWLSSVNSILLLSNCQVFLILMQPKYINIKIENSCSTIISASIILARSLQNKDILGKIPRKCGFIEFLSMQVVVNARFCKSTNPDYWWVKFLIVFKIFTIYCMQI